MAFNAYSLFDLFPRLCLRPLHDGCQGRFTDVVLRKRCSLLALGDVYRLIADSHEAQHDMIAATANAVTTDTATFSKTARAAILAGAGKWVGHAKWPLRMGWKLTLKWLPSS